MKATNIGFLTGLGHSGSAKGLKNCGFGFGAAHVYMGAKRNSSANLKRAGLPAEWEWLSGQASVRSPGANPPIFDELDVSFFFRLGV